MDKNMKKIWIGVIIIAAVALSLLLIVTQVKKESEEIRIGAILPLTGDAAIYGVEMKKGISLAVEELKEIDKLGIKVIYEDDQGVPRNAVSAAQKLITQDKVQVIISSLSSITLALAPIAQKNRIVLISPSASAPAITNAGDFVFRVWPSDIFEGGVMSEFAFNTLKMRNIAILYVNNDYGKGLEQVFTKKFEELGGNIIISEGYEFGATDFRTQIIKIKARKPEAIYIVGYWKEIIQYLKQARELNFRTQILSAICFKEPEILKFAGEEAGGAIFTGPFYDPQRKEKIVQDFVTKYEKKFNEEPGIWAAHSYDAMKIIGLAIKSGGTTATEIQKSMSKIKNFMGVTGMMSFDENGDVIKTIKIYTVKNKQFVPWGE